MPELRSMAARKMTFSLPSALAQKFMRRVPPRERSKYLTGLLERSLAQRESQLIRACRLVNKDRKVAAIEREMDFIEDPIEETWDDSSPR